MEIKYKVISDFQANTITKVELLPYARGEEVLLSETILDKDDVLTYVENIAFGHVFFRSSHNDHVCIEQIDDAVLKKITE